MHALLIRRLTRISLVYLVWASIGGIVAVMQDRPAGFAGQQSGLAVWKDFVFGMGTALSPTVWWLAIQALLTHWAPRGDRLGRVGVYGLLLVGFGEFIGAIGEPMTYVVFRPSTFDPLLAIVDSGLIILPALMMMMAFHARRGRAVIVQPPV